MPATIETDLARVPRAVFEKTIDALLGVRGHGPHFAAGGAEALKAAGDVGHQEEEFPERALRELWRDLELHHSGYVQAVLDDIEGMLQRREIAFPLAPLQAEAVLARLTRRTQAFLASLGLAARPTAVEVAAAAPWGVDLIEAAYRFGLVHHAVDGFHAPWQTAWNVASKRPLTDIDRTMIGQLRAGAGQYMRAVATAVPESAVKHLAARDRGIALRRTLVGARAGIHPVRLAGHMADLTGHKVDRGDGRLIWSGGKWHRDWRRVARTEMAAAADYGHLVAALERHEANADRADGEPLRLPKQLVFKIPQQVRRNDNGRLLAPCKHCHRIWHADDETPKLHPLKEVLDNGDNATGGLGGTARRAADWVATVGPTHPNCLCGPLQYFNRGTLNIYPQMAQQLLAFRGQGFEDVP